MIRGRGRGAHEPPGIRTGLRYGTDVMIGADIERVAQKLEAIIESDITEAPVDVLVLGPNINRKDLDAAKLRKEVLKRCQAYGSGIKAEHRKLVKIAEKRLGKSGSLCSYELKLAEACDAIVIVAASPGSFAEFGLFAMAVNLHGRILVLLNRDHRNKRSYVRLGPARSIRRRGGVIRWVDYSETEKVWSVIEQHITDARERKVDRRHFGGATR